MKLNDTILNYAIQACMLVVDGVELMSEILANAIAFKELIRLGVFDNATQFLFSFGGMTFAFLSYATYFYFIQYQGYKHAQEMYRSMGDQLKKAV